MPRFGVDGLYTSTLFSYRSELVARLVPGLELGRSFVRPEYQKTYSALLLLWRAIAEFVVRSPRYRLLFGVVSVSNDFRPQAQQRIVEFLREVELDYYCSVERPCFVRRSRGDLGEFTPLWERLDQLVEGRKGDGVK